MNKLWANMDGIWPEPILGPPLPEKGGPRWDFGRHLYSYWGKLGKIMREMPSKSLNQYEELPCVLYL